MSSQPRDEPGPRAPLTASSTVPVAPDAPTAAPVHGASTAGHSDAGRADWKRIVAVFWLTSMVEGLGVSQVFSFLAPYLRSVGRARTPIGRLSSACSRR